MKFKVGDHVVGNKNSWFSITKQGWRGKVVEVRDRDSIVVEALPGYDGGNVKFPVAAECFDLIRPTDVRRIVVTTDGKTTTARLYDGKTVLKSAEAKCSPEDEFNFETGAALAVARLLGREVQKTEAPATNSKPFSPAYLAQGRFGYTNRDKWFVVVENRLVYVENGGGWDDIEDLSADGSFPSGHRIEFIVSAYSLGIAKYRERQGNYVWHRD